MNFTKIMSLFAFTSCGPIGKIILFEVARTFQSYRASLILAYSDAQGALLVCTVLPGALYLYRDRINSLFLRMVSFCSLSSGIYSRIPANTTDNFNLLFFRVS